MRNTLIAVLAAAAAVAPVSATAVGAADRATAPVLKQRHARFGPILATRGHKALYYWTRERDFRVRCTGACARAWPPLVVRSPAALPRRIADIKGTFGVVRRPDGRLQVTHTRRPVYTYAHERPYQVLCDDVDGWFVVRV